MPECYTTKYKKKIVQDKDQPVTSTPDFSQKTVKAMFYVTIIERWTSVHKIHLLHSQLELKWFRVKW